MTISVVIATLRRPEALARCLDALDGQTRRPDELLVVARADDAPTLDLLSARASEAPLRWITVVARGVLVALASGLGHATGALVAITDDDATPHPDWLARLERHFRADSAVGGVGGRDWIGGRGGEEAPLRVAAPGPAVGRIRWYGRVVGNHHLGTGAPREVDVLKGANMAFRRTALAAAPLDPRLRGSGAQVHWELALCLAIKRAGWKLVYDPAVAVDHYPAERFDEDQRVGFSPHALRNEVHNEMYALLRWLPWWRRAVAFTYGLLVGTRAAPGPLLTAERIARSESPLDVMKRLRAATEGRLLALLTLGAAYQERRGLPKRRQKL